MATKKVFNFNYYEITKEDELFIDAFTQPALVYVKETKGYYIKNIEGVWCQIDNNPSNSQNKIVYEGGEI